jgi:hypothetical protein
VAVAEAAVISAAEAVSAAAAAAEEEAAAAVAAVVAEADLTAHLGDRLTVNWHWRLIGLLCQMKRNRN